MSHESQHDAAVVRQSIDDPNRFSVLYEKYYKHVFRFVYRHTRNNVARAERITHDAFLDAFEHRASYEDRGVPYVAYLYTIARRILMDEQKKHRAQPLPEETIDALAEGDMPDHASFTSTDAEDIWYHIHDTLTPTEFMIMWLKYSEELSPKAIGVTMDLTRNAVYQHISRARKKLRNTHALDEFKETQFPEHDAIPHTPDWHKTKRQEIR